MDFSALGFLWRGMTTLMSTSTHTITAYAEVSRFNVSKEEAGSTCVQSLESSASLSQGELIETLYCTACS